MSPSPRTPAALADWRTFAGRFRKYAAVGVSQAAVTSLAGDSLTIPLLLALGTPAAAATAIGALPVAGSVAQLGVPWLLRRANGDLRRVTLAILAVGELRGFWLAVITMLSASGSIPNQAAIVLIAAVMGLAGAAGTIGQTNLQAWYGAVLPENDRRFVAPKVVATNLGLGSVLLLPVALLIGWALPQFGTIVYAWVFLAAGLAGIGELTAVVRLRRPGRVLVHEDRPDDRAAATDAASGVASGAAAAAAAGPGAGAKRHGPRTGGPGSPTGPFSASLQRFLRIITIAAFGAGFGPYFSIYVISILHMPASYAILLSALSSASALLSSAAIGGWLHRGSSSRLLRLSFVLRGGTLLLGLLAFPLNPFAPLIMAFLAVVVSAGYSAGVLASNERLLRLASGPQLIRAQGRFVAGTAIGATGGQFSSAAVLALLPVGFPAFAILFAVSGLIRVVLIPFVEVSESWSSATMVWRVDELTGET
ncbi:MAG: hypothetical protein MUE82_09295, partial [Chloroflexi bacterium]|nr:hypothetical protein [Chloroflexota bacterium]